MTTTTTARVLCWRRTKNDTRGCASGVARFEIPQRLALALAVEIEEHGVEIGDVTVEPGHGVSIVYPSGRRREVRIADLRDVRSSIDITDDRRDEAVGAAVVATA